MPGEPTVPFEQYPDAFTTISVNLNAGDIPAALDAVPVMYVESRVSGSGIVVDDIIYGVSVVDATEDIQLIYAATPQATTGTAIHATATSLATVGTYEPTIDATNNFVPAGNWILAKFSDGIDTAFVTVQIRYRSRLK